eukprot:6492795-Amphidinium_carterae.3
MIQDCCALQALVSGTAIRRVTGETPAQHGQPPGHCQRRDCSTPGCPAGPGSRISRTRTTQQAWQRRQIREDRCEVFVPRMQNLATSA